VHHWECGGERGRHDVGVTYWFSFGFDLDWLSETCWYWRYGLMGIAWALYRISVRSVIWDCMCVEEIAIYLALLGLLLLLYSAQIYCFLVVDPVFTWGASGACVEVNHGQSGWTSASVCLCVPLLHIYIRFSNLSCSE
jgi:hypothetical protein